LNTEEKTKFLEELFEMIPEHLKDKVEGLILGFVLAHENK
jgi:hypothetical protein